MNYLLEDGTPYITEDQEQLVNLYEYMLPFMFLPTPKLSKGYAIKGVSKAELGYDFGKMGTYVENPGVKVDWSKFAEHGLERMEQRGVTKEMIEDFVQNGKVLSQNDGNKFAYITKGGVAVVSKDGKLITAWGKDNFDPNMIEIVNKLFGK